MEDLFLTFMGTAHEKFYDDILKDLGLPETAANARAVRILGYNRMELTVENILSMKEYDDKVTSLARDLKPAVVTELIRRIRKKFQQYTEQRCPRSAMRLRPRIFHSVNMCGNWITVAQLRQKKERAWLVFTVYWIRWKRAMAPLLDR